jgi:hypothetical protein
MAFLRRSCRSALDVKMDLRRGGESCNILSEFVRDEV